MLVKPLTNQSAVNLLHSSRSESAYICTIPLTPSIEEHKPIHPSPSSSPELSSQTHCFWISACHMVSLWFQVQVSQPDISIPKMDATL